MEWKDPHTPTEEPGEVVGNGFRRETNPVLVLMPSNLGDE